MNEYKVELLKFILENYDNVVKSAKGGEYIEIDLIPGGSDGLCEIKDLLFSTKKNNIDIIMFLDSYPIGIGDGLRMNRYVYFMQETTKQILIDLRDLKINKLLK